MYRDDGQFDKALAVYTRVDERVPGLARGPSRRAYPRYGLATLNRLGRADEAESALRAALALVQAKGNKAMIAATRRELATACRARPHRSCATRVRAALALSPGHCASTTAIPMCARCIAPG